MKLELFYNKICVSVQAERATYLKWKRSQPFPQELPEVKELSAEKYAKLTFWEKVAYRKELRKQKKALRKAKRAQKRPVDEQLTRGYNAGLEKALQLISAEYKAFCKRPNEEESE